MALEDALAANTAALKELTAAIKAGKGGKADAAIEAEAARVAGKGGAGRKAVTIDTIKERFGAYLGAEDPKVRKKRITDVQAMMAHFGVAKATELGKDQWAEAIGYLDQLEAGETPNYMDEAGGESLV